MPKSLAFILVTLAFGAGVLVGRAPVPAKILDAISNAPQATTTESATATDSTVPSEGAAVQAEQLSDSQQKMLSTLGVDTETIVITPAMVACAEAKIGAGRLAEIKAGATPSISEGAALLGCYRQ